MPHALQGLYQTLTLILGGFVFTIKVEISLFNLLNVLKFEVEVLKSLFGILVSSQKDKEIWEEYSS